MKFNGITKHTQIIANVILFYQDLYLCLLISAVKMPCKKCVGSSFKLSGLIFIVLLLSFLSLYRVLKQLAVISGSIVVFTIIINYNDP